MFNLQMFGSNDTVTSTNALQVEFGFSDEDTRIVTLQNARADIEASEVSALDA